MSSENEKHDTEMHQELSVHHHDPLIRVLHIIIRLAIRLLAILMVIVILWGVADVVYSIYHHLVTPPTLFLLDFHDIFSIFASVMVVLIGIEIFINVRLYLGSDVLPIKLVVATALMAVARKIIVLDLDRLTYEVILSLAATVLALGITYWLLSLPRKPR
ncbi:uncharacterized membrane protein (DUF373 family) [Alteromonadaceae bacterium 2753L.S.0a.02]|nr:uncharacterized membrane protein (DUF373 family) [Alteromonadaceae bacterium 2753L.S.0a.02]